MLKSSSASLFLNLLRFLFSFFLACELNKESTNIGFAHTRKLQTFNNFSLNFNFQLTKYKQKVFSITANLSHRLTKLSSWNCKQETSPPPQMILFLTVEEMMDMNRSRRLNFNAPFLSTKRHVTQGKLPGQCPEASVPFCWETTPGMPKNLSHLKNDSESETPRLKLPPARLKVWSFS